MNIAGDLNSLKRSRSGVHTDGFCFFMAWYPEQLKHPNWQKKRLEIFKRDNWTCINCNSTNKTLHIHHRIYINGKLPWEYDDIYLVTFCDQCHTVDEYLKKYIQKHLNIFLDNKNITSMDHVRSIMVHLAFAASQNIELYKTVVNSLSEFANSNSDSFDKFINEKTEILNKMS